MNLAEQIAAWLQKRADALAIMAGLMEKAAQDGSGRALATDEQTAYDAADAQLTSIDAQVERLRKLETAQARGAALNTPVGVRPAVQDTDGGTRAAPVIIKRDADEKFKGHNFVRLTIARLMGQIEGVHPAAFAHKRWGRTNPTLVEILTKANEIPSLGSATGDYGAELVAADQRYTADFINFLFARTIYNQLPLREVPANVQIKGQDGVGQAYWVGEGRAIGLTINDFLAVNLSPLKVAAIAVMSNEWMRDSTPAGELLVRDALVEAARQRVDGTFVSTTASVAGVSPAGIFNGVTAIASSGTTSDNVRDDVRRILQPFIDARNAFGLHWIMSPSLATSLSMMVNSLSSNREFPGVSADTGGTFLDKPVALGENLGSDVLGLVKPSDIYKIGVEGIRVELSRDATLEMSAAPTADAGSLPPTAAQGVSMFQTDSTAVKVVLPINFQKRRSHAAQFIQDAQYGETGTVTG